MNRCRKQIPPSRGDYVLYPSIPPFSDFYPTLGEPFYPEIAHVPDDRQMHAHDKNQQPTTTNRYGYADTKICRNANATDSHNNQSY